MTIKELAKIAGVSYSTVSKALNDYPQVADATRQRIKKLAEEYDFYINSNARNLKSQKSNTIALVFSRDELYSRNRSLLCTTLMTDLTQEIEARGYNYSVNVSRRQGGESTIKALYSQGLADGFILVTWENLEDDIRFLQNNKVPFAFSMMAPAAAHGAARFLADNKEEGYLATRHLIDKGHRRIVTVTGDTSFDSGYTGRTKGYQKAMEDAGLAPTVIFHSMDHLQVDTLYRDNANIFKKADSLYVQWDGMAGALMQALILNGHRVPEDISVMGHNDFYLTTYFVPQLTTVHDARDEQNRRAVDYVVRRIAGEEIHPYLSRATGYIVERQSVLDKNP